MISVYEARKILARNSRTGGVIKMNTVEATGYVIANDVFSVVDVPAFHNSAMDGYAVAFDGSRGHWKVVTGIPAGSPPGYLLKEGEAARIYTGSPLPRGADTVIAQEDVERSGNMIRLLSSGFVKGANVRCAASQVSAGGIVMKAGTRVTAGGAGLLASAGISGITVYAPPVVAVIVTGSELCEAGKPPEPGMIYNSNGPMLQAALKNLGITRYHVSRCEDNEQQLRRHLEKDLDRSDVIIVSGGISVGDYDFTKRCFDLLSVEELFYKVRQRPGKPFYAGKSGNKWVFGLPGNPASVLTCFNQFVKPCVKAFMGHDHVWEPDIVLPLAEDCSKKKGFTFFMKALREQGQVRLLGGQQSFNLAAFAQADCLAELDEDADLIPAGTPVNVYLL